MWAAINQGLFAARFNAALKAKGWRATEFIRAAEVKGYKFSYSLLSFYVHGKHAPGNIKRMREIAELLDVSVDYLMGEE